ncbi:MAG: hypothetical protein IJQ68_07260 [Methanobrevibacter sp.]|uniref:hypothetical protein n=1 Tax=Methanobrevibacter sp. TaxID=66852 RepID=UPI0025E57693|nr:hypothetical protein [Methanobrevibacter sp.]MBR0271769.1 hypothetical protein [Methanobrevibacter sp.]
MSEKDFDVDKEIERLSRKTNVNILRTEKSFDNRISQLEKDIDKVIKSKEKFFDDSKELTSKHATSSYTDNALERYKKKLNKI